MNIIESYIFWFFGGILNIGRNVSIIIILLIKNRYKNCEYDIFEFDILFVYYLILEIFIENDRLFF